MKKKTIAAKLISGICVVTAGIQLAGCGHEHVWVDATCMEARVCSGCGETEGEALGHAWSGATCDAPETCSICGETKGEALGHTWTEATCREAKHCTVCGKTEGEASAHVFAEANYQQAATCEVCGQTEGEPLTGVFAQHGIECNAVSGIITPYVTMCYDNTDVDTEGNLYFSDWYFINSTFEDFEMKKGYEWRVVEVTVTFDDENFHKYGWNISASCADYYAGDEIMTDFDVPYTINYNGVDYTDCMVRMKNLSENVQNSDVFTRVYRIAFRVPEGYDGAVVAFYNSRNNVDEKEIWELYDKDYLVYRLK